MDDQIVLRKGFAAHFARLFVYGALIFVAAIYLFPLLVVFLTSIKTLEEVHSTTILQLPNDPTFGPWLDAMFTACVGIKCTGLSQQFVNAVILVVPAVLISTPLGALNGFALSLWTFRGHNLVFGFLLFGMFIPLQIVLIPLAQVLGLIGLSNSIGGLVLLHVIYGIPFTTLFFRNYFVTLPKDLISAARLDGAGFLQVFRRIILPISLPSFVVSTIWQFTNIWNDFILATTFTSGDHAPVTVGLYNMVGTTTGVKLYNVDMAAVLITATPTLLVYIFAGRYFVGGLVAGSVKG